jgi:hypothetical protein
MVLLLFWSIVMVLLVLMLIVRVLPVLIVLIVLLVLMILGSHDGDFSYFGRLDLGLFFERLITTLHFEVGGLRALRWPMLIALVVGFTAALAVAILFLVLKELVLPIDLVLGILVPVRVRPLSILLILPKLVV